jgi:fatty acid-binding protein DegV
LNFTPGVLRAPAGDEFTTHYRYCLLRDLPAAVRRTPASRINKIISIHAASALSGIFNAAQTGASFNEHVLVIDSGQISLGLGFQVLAAAEAIEQGENLER